MAGRDAGGWWGARARGGQVLLGGGLADELLDLACHAEGHALRRDADHPPTPPSGCGGGGVELLKAREESDKVVGWMWLWSWVGGGGMTKRVLAKVL